MQRFHVNDDGNAGPCGAEKGNCPFGSPDDHYATAVEARAAYEAKNPAFSVVMSGGKGDKRNVNAVDANLSQHMAVAQQEFEDASDKNDWIAGKVNAIGNAQSALLSTAPGSPQRLDAMNARATAREQLLAADLVVWRDSPFYNEGVEARMKASAINVGDADSSLESALADEGGKATVANEHGVSVRDVENILELAHQDYLRPRGSLASPIGDLASNSAYAADTAHVFRIKPEAAQAILDYAASYSSIRTSPTSSRTLEDILA